MKSPQYPDDIAEQLALLTKHAGYDCDIRAFDGWNMQLWSEYSGGNGKPLVCFQGVSYIGCPVQFSHPCFRVCSVTEQQAIADIVGLEENEWVIAIEADVPGVILRQTFFIVLQQIELL